MNKAFEMKGITKTFLNGKIIANDNVSFSSEYGTIVGLVGENGAGKSTLMSVLFGLYKPDKGNIFVDGKKVKITSPLTANKLGIGMVPQHFKLVDNMTVTENIMLGVEKTKMGILDRKSVENKINELSKKYGLKIDPKAKVGKLSIGLKQRVEILKTLFKESKIIVFDEPTSVLTPQEAQDLIKILLNFKAAGKSVIFITHKLKEIINSTDHVYVMRKGKITGDIQTSKATELKLSSMMVGKPIKFDFKIPVPTSETKVSLKNINLKSRGVNILKDVTFDVMKGEILGLVGIEGNGQSEVAKIIAGNIKQTSGTFEINGITGKKLNKMYLNGLGHIPEERQKDGVALDMSFSENMIINRLDKYSKLGFINFKGRNKFAKSVIKKYGVFGANEGKSIFRGLSGGNQQKAVTGREIEYADQLLVAAHPTRGVDIGAIKNIYSHIIDKTNKGSTTILLSAELDEIMSVTNRIVVFSRGEIMGITNTKDVTREQVGLMMTGTKLESLKKKRSK